MKKLLCRLFDHKFDRRIDIYEAYECPRCGVLICEADGPPVSIVLRIRWRIEDWLHGWFWRCPDCGHRDKSCECLPF